ncbi:MAG: dihydrofolate reductase family protein [Candidatus Aenigmarchaeota archaeon]|nr:dihydrofolate reductase family protein [Candidatus Aenigmarchaeota archaeon]
MKVTLYMAMSVNGFVSKNADDTNFVSSVSWDTFRNLAKQTGNMIVGGRTYDIMVENNEMTGLEGVKIFVVTRNGAMKTGPPNVTFTNRPPQDILLFLRQMGFKEALVAGGGKVNWMFIKENAVDEIILDVEPIIFGRGTSLFSGQGFDVDLELIEAKPIAPNEVRLHYRVKRPPLPG